MVENGEITPRESVLHNWEVENFEKQAAHAITIKQLELAIKQEDNQSRIELKKLESKWASWLKIPKLIVLLPLYILMGIAYCICVSKRYEPSKKFWELLN